MSRLALALALTSLLGSVASLLVIEVFNRSLPFVALFLFQVVTIAAFVIAVRLTHKSSVTNLISLVPAWAKLILPFVAVAGGGLMASSLSSAMPRVSPSGKAVHSYSASVDSGECRAIYNREEHVVESLETCLNFEKAGSLGFIGAWLLFGAIALWLALVASAESGKQAMRANNSLERSREG